MSEIPSDRIRDSSRLKTESDGSRKRLPWGRIALGVVGLFAVAGYTLNHRINQDEPVFEANLHNAGIAALAPYLKKAVDNDLCSIKPNGHFSDSNNKGIANQIIPYKARGAFHIFGWYPNRYKGYLQTAELRAAYKGTPGTKDKPAIVTDAIMYLDGNDTRNVQLAEEDKQMATDPYVMYVLRQNKTFRVTGTPSEACRANLIRDFHEVKAAPGG